MDANGNSEAGIGAGSEWWLADESGTLVEIDEVIAEMPFDDQTADEIEVTHYKSPGRRKEYKAGMVAGSSKTLTVNYVPGSDTDALLAGAFRQTRAYRAIIPDETGELAWQIDGYVLVLGIGRSVPMNGGMQRMISIRFTGAIDEDTYTPTPTPTP